jgi:hypothetical protein
MRCATLDLHPEFLQKDDGQNERTFLPSFFFAKQLRVGLTLATVTGLDFAAPNACELAGLARVRHHHNDMVKMQPDGGTSSRADCS